MKVYISGRFQDKSATADIEKISEAIRAAHMKDFCFERDIEHFKQKFDDQKERWEHIYDELGACDSMLAMVEGSPGGKTVLEAGMAFAMRKPVVVAVKRGSSYKGQLDGIAAKTIEYDHFKELSKHLKRYEKERSFTITDKVMMFAVLLIIGGASAWALAQLFIPLAPIWAVIYWLIVRRLFDSMKDFDRIVIYIPLAALWYGGLLLLQPISSMVAWGWAIGFWLIAFAVIQKLKFSL